MTKNHNSDLCDNAGGSAEHDNQISTYLVKNKCSHHTMTPGAEDHYIDFANEQLELQENLATC